MRATACTTSLRAAAATAARRGLGVPRHAPASLLLRSLSSRPGPSYVASSSSSSEKPVGASLIGEDKVKGIQKMTDQMAAGVGWRDALQSGYYEQNKQKRDSMLADRLLELSQKPDFAVDDYEAELKQALEEIENGMSPTQRVRLFADRMQGGTMSKNVDQRKEELQRSLRIVGEFNAHERRLPKLLDRKAREAIAAKLGLEVQWIEDVIFQYQLQYAQWTFLRRELLRGKPIPTTNAEVEWRWKLEPTREFMEVMSVFRTRKKLLEEGRPGYEAPPRPAEVPTKRTPLKVRPYISSSYRDAERRKAPKPENKRFRGPWIVSGRAS